MLLALTVAIAHAVAVPARASAASGRPPIGLGQTPNSGTAAGMRSAPPTGQALAGTLDQTTGLTPAQVQLQDVCPAVAPGLARCAAQALILHSTHRLVRPDVARTRPLALGPRSAQPAAASAATAPAVSQPAAGTPAYLQQAIRPRLPVSDGGRGDTVAIVDAYDDPTAESDLGTFRSTSGLAACTTANGCFRKVNQSGAASPLPAGDRGWEEEISLDLDAVSALCPNCHILLVDATSTMSTDMATAMQTAARLGARQVSDSWSVSSSAPVGGTLRAAGRRHRQLPPATTAIRAPRSTTFTAAFAGVTAAGGTSLSATSNGQGGRGFAESAWSLGNDGWGGGSGCDLKLPKPLYQADSGCTGRAYADVSADADPATGLKIYDSGNGGWLLMGGTSLASPLIAAYYAITGLSAHHAAMGVHVERPAQRSGIGLVTEAARRTSSTSATPASATTDPPAWDRSPARSCPVRPGIGGPSVGPGTNNTYTQGATSIDATLTGGIYPNGAADHVVGRVRPDHVIRTAHVDLGRRLWPDAGLAKRRRSPGYRRRPTYHYRFVAQNSDGTTYGH